MLKGIVNLRRSKKQGLYIVDFPDECFPSSWLGSFVPVIFDFRGTESMDVLNDLRNYLYYLIPSKNEWKAALQIISREALINNTINGELFKKQDEPQNQRPKPPSKNHIVIRRRKPEHYYDRKKEGIC